MSDERAPTVLNPTQERTLEMLRRSPTPVVFDPDVIASLTSDLADAIDHLSERVLAAGDETIWLSKARISSVLGCEYHHLNPAPFDWTPALAAGTVAHRAIELLVGWRGEPIPATLVAEAIERLIDAPGNIGDWLAQMTEADRADLVNAAVDRVVKFTESFPPLDKRFIPVAESSLRWPESGPIVLAGKTDLTLGRAENGEARKVIIDLKTGGMWPNHLDDLRFYALLETMRVGIPPRKVAGFYLDVGRAVVEDVTIDTLRSAAHRTLDALGRAVELIEGREPERRPQASCRWCPHSTECEPGTEWLTEQAERDD
jgi:hypothetical protein